MHGLEQLGVVGKLLKFMAINNVADIQSLVRYHGKESKRAESNINGVTQDPKELSIRIWSGLWEGVDTSLVEPKT